MNKKTAMFSLLFLWSLLTYAQIPAGYYDPADGLTGTALKSALHSIIDGHTEYSYTSSSTDVWDILKQTDKDPNNSNNVLLLYTGWSVNAAQEYNSGAGWTREHVWAKSRGNFGTSKGAGTDVHHLRPCDVSVNSARNNRWFDNAPTQYIDGGVPTDSYYSTTDWIWEPRDAVKGDVARMLFYMVVRYEGGSGEPDLELVDYLPSNNSTTDPIHAILSTLLQWHLDDPVDSYEINRNDVIYSFQNNRNPFIDHPEYVCEIWGGPCPGSGGGGGGSTAHVETFDNFTASTSYANGTFIGVDGISWSYVSTKGTPDITGKAATMAKGKTPAAEVASGTIPNGIGTLKFDYMQPYSTSLNFDVYVNGSLVDNITSSGSGTVKSTPEYTVNASGNSTIKIVQNSTSAGQLTIDNIAWTDYSTGGGSGGSVTTFMETFDNSNATSSYSNGNFVGDSGDTWYYTHSRNEYNYGITGKGLMLRRSSSNSKVTVENVADGISELSFDLKKGFTGSGNRQVEVYINGNSIGTSTPFDDTQTHHVSFENIDESGTFDLEIRNITSKQVVIDNIEWSSFASKTTDVQDIASTETSVSVYPIPFENVLNIDVSTTSIEANVSIYDINGRMVFNQSVNNPQSVLDVSQLEKGIYILKIQGETHSSIQRIQKM